MKTLPKKPSALIRLAIKDLEACELDHDYEIQMSEWYRPQYHGPTLVCLSGAIMVKTLKEKSTRRLLPNWVSDIKDKDIQKLYALNEFRTGCLEMGLDTLGYSREIKEKFKCWVSVTPYCSSPDIFKIDMLDMARQFEKAGL
jgi:hypothetical protein